MLKSKREKILINLEQEIKPKDVLKFLTLIKRRSNNEPVSYITNEKEFWSKTFFVNKFTLIPRPETELMIEKLSMIFKNKRISILDIGTGSGCILLSLLSEIKNAKGEMLGSEGFQNYIKKHKEKPNDERLEIIIDEILNSGHIQKDDLTIVVIDSKN